MSRLSALLSILIALCGLMMLPDEQVMAGKLADQLINAAELGEIDTVKKLLDQGVPAEARNPDGWTALMKATYEGHEDIVRLLSTRAPRSILKKTLVGRH